MNDATMAELDIDAINRLLIEDPKQAAALLSEAARNHRADAQVWLGQLYLDGRGVPKATDEAVFWFQCAAHYGSSMAMNMLGRCYENGWGACVDYELAKVWYQRAADANLDWGCYNLAQMLAGGRGTPKNRAEAFYWFQRAVNLGHARAMHFLGQFYEYGWEVESDQAKAFDLYRRSAEGGDYRGLCSWASVLISRGEEDEAVNLLEKSIRLAPAHYLEYLAAELRASGSFRIQALADQAKAHQNKLSEKTCSVA